VLLHLWHFPQHLDSQTLPPPHLLQFLLAHLNRSHSAVIANLVVYVYRCYLFSAWGWYGRASGGIPE
jgi:hypothetical protein